MDPAAGPWFAQEIGDPVDDGFGEVLSLGTRRCRDLACRWQGLRPRCLHGSTVVLVLVELISPRLKEPAYRLYEMRLRQELARSKSALPRHIAVLCDGNRRWARDAGYDDVSFGYRMGAAKIAEMLRWCAEAGIEMATVYLLSTENLQRDADELTCLIEIITEVVEQICACLLYTSPSPRDGLLSRMPSSA